MYIKNIILHKNVDYKDIFFNEKIFILSLTIPQWFWRYQSYKIIIYMIIEPHTHATNIIQRSSELYREANT